MSTPSVGSKRCQGLEHRSPAAKGRPDTCGVSVVPMQPYTLRRGASPGVLSDGKAHPHIKGSEHPLLLEPTQPDGQVPRWCQKGTVMAGCVLHASVEVFPSGLF